MENRDTIHGEDIASAAADRIKQRMKLLVLASTISVGLVFGLSFYFALLANSTAVARKVPELVYVTDKMKSLLMTNTLIFVAIIVASFYYLSRLVTSRIFGELNDVGDALLSISRKKLPNQSIISEGGPFSELKLALKNAIYSIREKELKELEFLRSLSKKPLYMESEALESELKRIIGEKRKLLGLSSEEKIDISERERETVQ